MRLRKRLELGQQTLAAAADADAAHLIAHNNYYSVVVVDADNDDYDCAGFADSH